MTRTVKVKDAILEGMHSCMERDERVYVMGLGVPDPKGMFGTTLGLQETFGVERAFDIPTSENGMTGVAIGSALVGRRPILIHQRVEFALLAVEQMVNQAAKWHYMFGGRARVPLVVRLVVGRGWGQGAQHSQSLQSWFAHIPGLKVVLPATAADAKGLLIASIEDDNPVVFIEHRWLHETFGEVPEGHYSVPLGKARVAREGDAVTIVACSYMVLEALKAAEVLSAAGIEAEVVDLRTIAPYDHETVMTSVRKTGRLLVTDIDWKHAGFAAEVISRVVEEDLQALKAAPRRACVVDVPRPTSRALAPLCSPRARQLVDHVRELLELPPEAIPIPADLDPENLDAPNPEFKGPF